MIPRLGACSAINIERNNIYPRLTLPGEYSGTEFRGDAGECVFPPSSIVGCEQSRNRRNLMNRGSERIIVGVRGDRYNFGLQSHGQSRSLSDSHAAQQQGLHRRPLSAALRCTMFFFGDRTSYLTTRALLSV